MKSRITVFFFALVFFFATPSAVRAQSGDKSFYIGPGASYNMLPIASLNAQIHDFGFSSGFANPIGVGIDYGGHYTSDKVCATSLYSFHWLLPQDISLSDTTGNFSMKMKGYLAQFDIFNFDFVRADNICFTAGLAWAFGRIRVDESSPAGSTTFTNTFFAPQFRTEFNVKLGGHFYIGARAAYRDDVTKSAWAQSGIHATDLAPTNFSGWTFGGFIGFGN